MLLYLMCHPNQLAVFHVIDIHGGVGNSRMISRGEVGFARCHTAKAPNVPCVGDDHHRSLVILGKDLLQRFFGAQIQVVKGFAAGERGHRVLLDRGVVFVLADRFKGHARKFADIDFSELGHGYDLKPEVRGCGRGSIYRTREVAGIDLTDLFVFGKIGTKLRCLVLTFIG